MTHADRRARIVRKILLRVVITESGCWVWTGPTSGTTGRGRGYPRMCLDGATIAVHKTMFVCEYGPVPPKKQIDHKCKNRLCVRPEHLEMVTHRENQRRRDSVQPEITA